MWKKRKIKKTGTPTFQCMNPNAAGVDVGAMEIYIAVPADRDPPTGAVLLDIHRRPARRRRLVEGFEDRDRSDGIDGSLLDSVVPDSRGSRIHGLVGQRASCEERAGAQIGCFRLPVAAIFAFRRSTARIVPLSTESGTILVIGLPRNAPLASSAYLPTRMVPTTLPRHN